MEGAGFRVFFFFGVWDCMGMYVVKATKRLAGLRARRALGAYRALPQHNAPVIPKKGPLGLPVARKLQNRWASDFWVLPFLSKFGSLFFGSL